MYIGSLGALGITATTTAEKLALLELLYKRLMAIPTASSLPEMKTIRQAIDQGRLDSALSQINSMESWVVKRTGKNLDQLAAEGVGGWGLTGQIISGVPNWALYVAVVGLSLLAAKAFGKKKGR